MAAKLERHIRGQRSSPRSNLCRAVKTGDDAVLGTLIRDVTLRRLPPRRELLYPTLIVVVLVILGHLAGLIGVAG